MNRVCFFGRAVVLALAAVACSSEGDDGADAKTPCAEAVAAQCDIRETECQRNTYCAIQKWRGVEDENFPAVEFITVDDYAKKLTADEKPPTDFERDFDAVLALFGFADPNSSLDEQNITAQLEQVLGFYDNETARVYMVDRVFESDPATQVMALAHEFVHVAQDREHDFAGLMMAHFNTSDEALATWSLVEGEAVHISNLFLIELNGDPLEDVDFEAYYHNWLYDILRQISESESLYVAVKMMLPYPLGGAHVTSVWLEGGVPAVQALWSDFPLEVRGWMKKPPKEEPPEEPATRPSPFGLLAQFENRMGAGLVYAWLTGLGLDFKNAWLQAMRWRGDWMHTYSDKAGKWHAAEWRVRFADKDTAEDIARLAKEAKDERWSVFQDGPDVVVYAASSAALLSDWLREDKPPGRPSASFSPAPPLRFF